MINYVSNLPRNLRSGGFSSMNVSAYEALSRGHAARYVGPVDPAVNVLEKARSKSLRTLGLPGGFFFYSESRLKMIAREVEQQCHPEARMDFFHGFTPWVLTRPSRPYMAFSDCTFRDYIEIYHPAARFQWKDLARIEQAEAAWLRGAAMVLLRSRWAAERAIEQCGLDAQRVRVVPSCSDLALPVRQSYAGARAFVFVATDFAAKGGPVLLEAFRDVLRRHADATLMVVGDRPADARTQTGVVYSGFLRKEVASELSEFRRILGSARALVHPSRGDVAPVIVVEAGYFGCPAIASRRFAIPELVEDGTSGLLLDDPDNPTAVAAAMNRMLEEEDEYHALRHGAWAKSRSEYSRERADACLVACAAEGLRLGAAAP